MSRASCIGCGCDDFHACEDADSGNGCWWVRVDYLEGKGVCSECGEHVDAWDRGDRTSHAEPIALSEIPREERSREPAPIMVRPDPASIPCPHDWPYIDIQETDACRWCGMSFLRHVFTECP